MAGCSFLRAWVVALALSASVYGTASAGWQVRGGLETFGWGEYNSSGMRVVDEGGLRYTVSLQYLQERELGLLFGYFGKAYAGNINYQGYSSSGNSISTSSGYGGMMNEVQVRYRIKGGDGDGTGHSLDIVGSIGMDTWSRSLKSVGAVSGYTENYIIYNVKAGIDIRPASDGLIVESGVKLPISTSETVKLKDAGQALEDAVLHPEGLLSYYGSIGYKFKGRWSMTVTYDTYRFGQSAATNVNTSSGVAAFYQPATKMDTVNFSVGYSF